MHSGHFGANEPNDYIIMWGARSRWKISWFPKTLVPMILLHINSRSNTCRATEEALWTLNLEPSLLPSVGSWDNSCIPTQERPWGKVNLRINIGYCFNSLIYFFFFVYMFPAGLICTLWWDLLNSVRYSDKTQSIKTLNVTGNWTIVNNI